jgi:hypothetical protein
MFTKPLPNLFVLPIALGLLSPLTGAEDDAPAKPKPADKVKEIAGTSEFLRSVPKHFATLKAIDPKRRQVTLLIEGESLPKVWSLTPDAELKIAGWWARLDQFAVKERGGPDQFTVGDRVWAWFETNRDKQPVAIFMLCDELSEQDIHGGGGKVEANTASSLTIKDAHNKSRRLKAKGILVAGAMSPDPLPLEENSLVGQRVFLQSRGDEARWVCNEAWFKNSQSAQKQLLRKRWIEEGLPGSVTFLHRLTGELELMLDHETMRWARSLKPGAEVTLVGTPPIKGVVRQVKPWRERTQVRLVVTTFDQADLRPGQRIALKMPAPAEDIERAALPPDVDRPRATRDERIDWFLASIYCTCKIGGDGCTGHFYTLASCNPNACGMPKMARQILAEKIDKGLSDRQIFEELIKERGPDLLRPHLLP